MFSRLSSFSVDSRTFLRRKLPGSYWNDCSRLEVWTKYDSVLITVCSFYARNVICQNPDELRTRYHYQICSASLYCTKKLWGTSQLLLTRFPLNTIRSYFLLCIRFQKAPRINLAEITKIFLTKRNQKGFQHHPKRWTNTISRQYFRAHIRTPTLVGPVRS